MTIAIALLSVIGTVASIMALIDTTPESSSGSNTDSADSTGTVDPAGVSQDPSADKPGLGIPITLGRNDWDEERFQSALYQQLLIELGYAVADPAENELPLDELYRALADGRIDIVASGRALGHEEWLAEARSDGTKVEDHVVAIGDQLPAGGLFGLVITTLTARDHQIRSLDQINDSPELVALFDGDGNGKADILGCPVGDWCSTIIDESIAFNDWDNLEQIHGDSIGHLTDQAKDLVGDGEPAIHHTWSPSEHVAYLVPGQNVRWLSFGTAENVIDGSTPSGWDYRATGPAPLGDLCTDDPCWLGWAWDDIQAIANRDFIAANRPAARLLELVTLDAADLGEQNGQYFQNRVDGYDLGALARSWITDNQALVDDWLADARKA